MPETGFSKRNQEPEILDFLPSVQQLDLQPLCEKYAPLTLQVNILSTLLILACGVLGYFQPWFSLPALLAIYLPQILALVAVAGLSFSALEYVADKQKRYALREQDLHFSSGLIFRKTISQPITRIQHVELKSGPLERYRGLASLQVFSAGGASHTFEIPGLAINTAKHIRQLILQHQDLSRHG